MALRYHGLVVGTPDSGELRFGMECLIGSCQSWLWYFQDGLSDSAKQAVSRFHNRAYWQCAKKCKDTVHKLNKAVYNLSCRMDIMERKEEYVYDGAPLEKAAAFFEAIEDIPYHLDSLISYLRVLADCIAFAIPFFYRTDESIANRSFRDHRKWFLEKKPDFDAEYAAVLQNTSTWFNRLAGEDHKGIRDIIFHHFSTYQLGWSHFPDGKMQVLVQQVASDGIHDGDLIFTINDTIAGFFEYLDATYAIFGERIAKEFEPLTTKSLEERSIFVKFTAFTDLRRKYRLYPLIGSGGTAEQGGGTDE